MHVGIDIVKIDRLDISNNSFLSKVLSNDEIEIFNNENKKREFLAGRYALKEAIIKTFEGNKVVIMNEINIRRNENGVPICEYENYNIVCSISHDGEYAIAIAIRME